MADSVALLGWDESPIRVVQDVQWLLDDRADSTNQVRVTTSLAEADGVDAEQELIFKERGFTISGVERDRAADEAVITADEHQAALADVVIVGFRPNSWTLTRAMNAVLDGTRWTLGEVSGTRYGRADFDEITALDALHFLARHQDAKLSFDSLRRRVNITPDTGTTHEYVFTYGRQLSNITKDVQQPTTTVIYPTMADDVALDPVEDYGYYLSQGISLAEAKARFRKEEYWDDSRYEIEENMTRDSQKRLEEEAYPRTTYTLTAQATVDVEGADDFDLAELRLGDTVYVWDQEIDTKLSAEVTAVTTSSDQSQNELTLSTLPASLGDSVSDRGYFGDSGKPSSGGPRRSGPQPKPSMPILEQVSDYGTAATRWNGQDSEGNFDTIPQRFGTLLTLVAPLTDGVIPSPNDSSQTFMGSDITKRGGGLSNIGFNDYGEFAVWHQMRGWDGMTLSEFSEPLVIDVPPAWDPQPTVDKLDNLDTVRLPGLEQDLTDAQQQAEADLSDLDTTLRGAFSTQLDTVLEALQGAGRTWSQDTAPPAGATYEWSGAEYESASIKRVDGVEVARNLSPDPSFEISTDETSYQSSIFSTGRTGTNASQGEWSRYFVTHTQATSAVNFHQEIPVSGGEWAAFRVDRLRASLDDLGSTAVVGLRIGALVGGSWTYSSTEQRTVEGAGSSVHMVTSVPAGATALRAMIYPYRDEFGVRPAPGDTYWIDGLHVATADTEADALAQVEIYFDGDTLDDRQNDLWINSNGTQHRWDNATKQWTAFTNAQLQDSVDEALSKADAALTQAGTKNTVYYGTTDPAFDGIVAGDQYRKTDGSDDVIDRWRWNGAQWVGESITSEVIDNLDVGKLTAGSVTTPEAVIDKLMVDGITARSSTVARQVVAARNLYNDPNFERAELYGGWTVGDGWIQKSGTGSFDGTYADAEDMLIPAEPGDEFEVTVYAHFGSGSVYDAVIYTRSADADGNYIPGSASATVSVRSGGTNRGTFTAHDNAAYVYIGFYTRDGMGPSDSVRFSSVRVQSTLEGRMIVDGLLQATTGELEELFFDTAVGNTVAAGVGEFLELNADQIRSNSWTGIVATGATFQTHADANRGVKMTPAGLRGWDASGDLSFRFNGTNNYLRGSLHAGTSSNSEIRLDYGDKQRISGVTDEGDPANQWTIYTPSIDFHSGNTYQPNQEPSIFIDGGGVSGEGQMAINPGYLLDTPTFRSRINVLGDIAVNRVVPRERFQINTSRSDQPGVIQHVGQGVRIRGQIPVLSHSQEMFYTGQTDQASLNPGGLRKRTISWGVPVPRGRRDPIVTVYMAAVPSDNNAYVVANVSRRFTNSYRLDEYNPSTATANYWVGVIAPWRNV